MQWCELCRGHFDNDHYITSGGHGIGEKYGPYGVLLEKAESFDAMERAWRKRCAQLEHELAELAPETRDVARGASRDSEPIHAWFSLTYANYLVLARSMLQSMPHGWQERFVMCLEELEFAFSDYEQADSFKVWYSAQAQDGRRRFAKDPVPHYNRGRTFLPNKLTDKPVWAAAIVSEQPQTD